MRKLISLIATSVICAMLIVPASANPALVEMSHAEAAALINKEMDNWTESDIGAWLVGHSYKYQEAHGFFAPMYGTVFIFKASKGPSSLDENGFDCSRVIGSVYLPDDLKNSTNGIAARICVKGDVVTVDITGTLKRESF